MFRVFLYYSKETLGRFLLSSFAVLLFCLRWDAEKPSARHQQNMLNINEVRNGRIYSVVFAGPVKMNVGGRERTNPLADLEVTKRTVMSIQACSRESYAKRKLKLDPEWSPSERASGYDATMHPCVDINLKTGEHALRGWACGVTKHEVFVGEQPATEAELAIIAQYQPEREAPTFMRLPLAKIEHEGWVDVPE